MPRILLDENIPVGLRRLIVGHEVHHVARLGWDGLSNGALIRAAEREGYDVFLTADQSLSYQQNLAGRRIAIVVLSTNDWDLIRAECGSIVRAIGLAAQNSLTHLDIGRAGRPRDRTR